MAEVFKFRCFQCNKLLGISRSKIGTTVNCPRCGIELIVPLLDDSAPPAEESADPEAFRPEDIGLRLEPERLVPSNVAFSPSRDPLEPNPIAFLEKVATEPGSESPDEATPSPAPSENEPAELPEPPDPLNEPLVARKKGRRPSVLIEPAARRRDVILPRTAVVAWAMFALVGLACAFIAGLMIGHYLWR